MVRAFQSNNAYSHGSLWQLGCAHRFYSVDTGGALPLGVAILEVLVLQSEFGSLGLQASLSVDVSLDFGVVVAFLNHGLAKAGGAISPLRVDGVRLRKFAQQQHILI